MAGPNTHTTRPLPIYVVLARDLPEQGLKSEAFYRAYPQVREVAPVKWALRWLPTSTVRVRKNVRSLTGQSQPAVMKSQIVRGASGAVRDAKQGIAQTEIEKITARDLERPGKTGRFMSGWRHRIQS